MTPSEIAVKTLSNILAELDKLVTEPNFPELPELDDVFDAVQSALAKLKQGLTHSQGWLILYLLSIKPGTKL